MQRSFYEHLISTEAIPPLPASAARLLTLATDPDVDIDRLVEVIEQDPPLVAKVLGIANSAFYSPRTPVLTVKEAIVRVLGLRMVANLSFGLAIGGGLDTSACPSFDLTRYWVLALGTADMAAGLARATTLTPKPDDAATYLVGLLHNVGELLLVHLRPGDMDRLLREDASQPGARVVELERQWFGTDHWAAGALLMRHWQLPAVVADTIEHFDNAADLADCSTMLHLVRAARAWIEGAVTGRSDDLHVSGVDDSYCEYRTTSFLENYVALKAPAASL